MDFRFDERQEATQKAATAVFADTHATDIWQLLADAGLTGLTVAEVHGGAGCGVLEACVLLVEQGRCLAPVPVAETILAAAIVVDRFGSPSQGEELLPAIADGRLIAVPALGAVGETDGRLHGTGLRVPYGRSAHVLLVPVDGDIALVEAEAPGVRLADQTTTSGRPQADLELRDVHVDRLRPGAARLLRDLLVLGTCAQQVGVLEEALRLTAEYTSQREQFGRKLATFQAVTQRAADAYRDVATCRVTMWRAAWLLAAGEPATSALSVAKFWAAEAGYQVSAAAQHLHGGIGVSTDYPLHRYTRWARENELVGGSAEAQLGALGEHLVDGGPDS